MANAIERVMNDRKLKTFYEFTHPLMLEDMLKEHPLNHETDDPIPEWAISILKDKRVGFKIRVRMILTHHYDITNERVSNCVKTGDVITSPSEKIKGLAAQREKASKRAEEFIAKKKGLDNNE